MIQDQSFYATSFGVALPLTSIATNTTTVGSVIDLWEGNTTFQNTSEMLAKFKLILTNFVSAGVYTPLLEASDDNITYTPITDEYLYAQQADTTNFLVPVTIGQESFSALSANGSKEIGVKTRLLNKRYLRVSIVSSGVTGSASLEALYLFNRNYI